MSYLGMVRKKILVLDLDETLIHSHHDGVIRQTVKPGTPPDFVLKVTIDRHPVRFFVHKRPHVDFFLDVVSRFAFKPHYEFTCLKCCFKANVALVYCGINELFLVCRFHNGIH